MARLKSISEEERAAKAQLRQMGVSDYELNRLYDANYKAKQRAAASGASPGKTLNLSWQQVLRNAQQAQRQGKTASDYINIRRQTLAKQYKASTEKKRVRETYSQNLNQITGEVGRWSAELFDKLLKRSTGAELGRAETDAINELLDAEEIDEDFKRESYRAAKNRYVMTNASTQEEWDKLLQDELTKDEETLKKIQEKIAENLDVDLSAVDEAQEEANEYVNENFDLTDEKEARAASRYLAKRKREVFSEYGL